MRHLELLLVCLGIATLFVTVSAQDPVNSQRTASEAIRATDAGQLAVAQKEADEKKRLEQEKAELNELIEKEKAAETRLAQEKAELIPEVKEVVENPSKQQDTPAAAETTTDPVAESVATDPSNEPFFGYKSNKPIPYLAIVSNNRIPKDVFADFLLKEFDIPHLLLPPNGPEPVADEAVFFIGGSGDTQAIIQITAKQLSEFIAFLRPETVILLGDTTYIHPAYRMAVPENIRMLEFSNSLWRVNAVSLDNMLHSGKIFRHFEKYLKEKDAAQKAALKAAEENAPVK